MRTYRHHHVLFVFYCGLMFGRGKIILQEPKNNWKGWNDFRGTSWLKGTYSGKPVFASCSPGSANEGWLLLPFIDNVPSSVKTLTVKFSFTFRKCSSFTFPPVPCNEQVELLRREENKPVRLSELRRKQFDVAATVTAKQEKMSSVPPVGAGPRSFFSGTVHKTGSKGIYLAIKNVASCIALFTFQVSYAGPCTSQGVNLMKLKETVAPESSSTEIEVNGSCVDNAVPTPGSSRLYAICHSSGEWTAGVNASCVCKQGYQQDIDQNKCEGKILLIQEPLNNWKDWVSDFRGTSWSKVIYSGKPVFASCSPGSTTEGWILLPFIDNVPSSVKTLTVKFSFTFRKCSSFTFPPVPCNEQVELLRREENRTVRISELRQGQFDVASTVTSKQVEMSSVPPVGVGPRSTFSGTVKTRSKGIYLAIKNIASCFALFTFEISYATCPSQGVGLIKVKETVAPASGSTVIEVNGSCVDNAVPTKGSSRLYAICHSSGEWTAGVNGSCVCIQGYQQSIDQNKCYECPAGTYKDVAANTMCRVCPKYSKPGCLRDECVCKRGYYRVPVDQNETPCEALPPSPKLSVTTVISSTAVFISWFPAPRATRYSVECVMCSKAFTGYCYNCRRNVKFCPSRDSIPGTSVFISGLKPSTFFKFKVFSRNQLNEVVSKGKWNYLQVNLKTKSFG